MFETNILKEAKHIIVGNNILHLSDIHSFRSAKEDKDRKQKSCIPSPARKRSISAKVVEMDLTIDYYVIADNSYTLKQTKNDEKSGYFLQKSIIPTCYSVNFVFSFRSNLCCPKSPRSRPKKSPLKAITSGQKA